MKMVVLCWFGMSSLAWLHSGVGSAMNWAQSQQLESWTSISWASIQNGGLAVPREKGQKLQGLLRPKLWDSCVLLLHILMVKVSHLTSMVWRGAERDYLWMRGTVWLHYKGTYLLKREEFVTIEQCTTEAKSCSFLYSLQHQWDHLLQTSPIIDTCWNEEE